MTYRLPGVIIAFFILVGGVSVSAEENKSKTFTSIYDQNLGWLHISRENTKFEVFVDDQVSGGCWKKSKAAKNAVELEIKRSGYKIADDSSFLPNQIILFALGYKTKADLCIVSHKMLIMRPIFDRYQQDNHTLTSLSYTKLWDKSGILSGGEQYANIDLKEQFVENIQAFLLEIEKSKIDIYGAITKSFEVKPEAVKYWKKILPH